MASGYFTHQGTGRPFPPSQKVLVGTTGIDSKCLENRDSLDGSPPGSSVPGILQARTLEWVAISFSNA